MTFETRVLPGMLAVLLASCVMQVQASQPPDATPTATSHYVFIPASTFVPRDSSAVYQYIGGGCVSAPLGAQLVHKLILPEGSVLHYVRSFYKDASPYDIKVYVTQYDAAGAYADVGSVFSVDGWGYTSGLSGDMNYTVDAQNQAYLVNAQIFGNGNTIFKDGFDGADDSLVFCGARVMYDQ